MKRLAFPAVLILLLFAELDAFAQEEPSASTTEAAASQAPAQQPAPAAEPAATAVPVDGMHAERREAAHNMKIGGMITTLSGVGVTVIGVTMVVLGLSYFTVSLLVDWDSLGHWGSVYVAGACLTGVGAAAMAVGLPIWIVGRVRERRLDQQLEGQQSRGRPSVLVAPLFAYSPPERAAVGGVTLIF